MSQIAAVSHGSGFTSVSYVSCLCAAPYCKPRPQLSTCTCRSCATPFTDNNSRTCTLSDLHVTASAERECALVINRCNLSDSDTWGHGLWEDEERASIRRPSYLRYFPLYVTPYSPVLLCMCPAHAHVCSPSCLSTFFFLCCICLGSWVYLLTVIN